MRLQAKAILSDDSDKKQDLEVKADSKSSVNVDISAKSSNKSKVKLPRPAWSLTESAAGELEDELELEDPDDLIEFAKGLDFEKYIDDLEVQTMIDRVKKRIAELERDSTVENQRVADAEIRQAMKSVLESKVLLADLV